MQLPGPPLTQQPMPTTALAEGPRATIATTQSPIAGELWWMDPTTDAWRKGLMAAVTWLRVALVAWATIVVIVDASGTTTVNLPVAIALLLALGLWTLLEASWLRGGAAFFDQRWVAGVEVVLAMAVSAADYVVYDIVHPQSFGSAWPMSAAVVVGIWWGARWGGAAGASIALSGAVGQMAVSPDGLDGQVLATLGHLVLLVAAGVIAGLLTERLRTAELGIARARAREEVARELHDGVLQTLAVVQRRSDDPALVTLARDQELDLRRYIAVTDDGAVPRRLELTAAVRDALIDAERRTRIRCQLTIIDAPSTSSPEVVAAITGAIGEAVTNADKHGGASRVVVCLDRDEADQLICSINDDGSGFDPEDVVEGTGLTRSVRGRLDDVGGTVSVSSRPGHGCEIVLCIGRP